LNQMVIIPRQSLPLNTTITLTFSKGVKDTQSNALAAAYTTSFKLAISSGNTQFVPIIKK